MNRILDAEQQIRDLTNQLAMHERVRGDNWTRLCVALDTLGDSAVALRHFEACGLGSTEGERYIGLYGALQAVFLQQDAIKEIYRLYVGSEANILPGSAWQQCRTLRNLAVGHPIDAGHGNRHVFISRRTITPDGKFDLLIYDKNGRGNKDPVDFITLYSSYKEEALGFLGQVQAKLRTRDVKMKKGSTSKKIGLRLALFDEFLGKLVSDLGMIKVPDGKRVYTGCLLCRIASNLIATRRLLNYHHVLEADMLVRSALEALFWLGALIEDEGFIDSISADHDHRFKQRARLKLNLPPDLLHVSSAEREALNKKIAEIEEKGSRSLNPKEVADRSDAGSLYPLYIDLSNRAAHSSADSLERHLVATPEKRVLDIVPADENPESTIFTATNTIFMTKILLTKAFHGQSPNWHDEGWARVKTLLASVEEDQGQDENP
jgi:hypothetical protein